MRVSAHQETTGSAAPTGTFSATARRRIATATVLGLLAVVAWIASVRRMDGMGMEDRFSVGSFGFFVVLWVVMMAAMMFPSVWPTLSLYGTIMRNRSTTRARAGVASAAFVGGYLAAWTAYGLLAFAALEIASRAGLGGLSDTELARYVVAPVALAAAAYQLAPLKQACLNHCRGPFSFLLHHWRSGLRGAVSMGTIHGAYCVGCCWMLMLVLLSLGMMSVTWMAVVSVAIAVEKLTPTKTTWLPSTLLGVGLAVLGLVALIRPTLLPGMHGMGGGMNDQPAMQTTDMQTTGMPTTMK
jgi:predicted metal-binding membrane protein